ncbi:MAG TPA: hypothetical protein VHC48_03905 [Puia sp.]|jgi:hypothetical protein|nr:hypothetical protein [Puia sp.]
MKPIKPINILVAGTLLLASAACRKEVSVAEKPSDTSQGSLRPVAGHDTTSHQQIGDTAHITPPFPETPPVSVSACSFLPIYGDTIIYPQPAAGGQDYIFNVVNSPGTGKYFAWPQGMVIDPNTGAIDLTKSETGLKYAIGFVREGTTDTCLSTLIVGGAAYMDSIYVLADGQDAALPYYDANPYLASVCAGGGCTFDVNGTAANDKVIVDHSTGKIDLKKTLDGTGLLSLGGAFGLLPVNGSSLTTRIYYKLNDPSNNALQHIDVQLQYYDTRSAISGGLLGTVVNKLNNLLSGNMISNWANPRPPLIMIVRR